MVINISSEVSEVKAKIRKGPLILPEGTSIQDAIDTAVHYDTMLFVICHDSHEDILKSVSDWKGCIAMKPLNKEKIGPDESWPKILIDPPF